MLINVRPWSWSLWTQGATSKKPISNYLAKQAAKELIQDLTLKHNKKEKLLPKKTADGLKISNPRQQNFTLHQKSINQIILEDQ